MLSNRGLKMKLTKKRIKEIIKEEIELFNEARVTIREEEEIDLSAVQDDATKVAGELMKDGSAIDDVIEKAAQAIAGDAPDQLPLVIQIIKQEMAKAQG